MSVLDYVEPLHVKEGKELQDFEREIFGGGTQNKDADIDALNKRLASLTADNELLKSSVRDFYNDLPFLPKSFPDFPSYKFRLTESDHPVIASSFRLLTDSYSAQKSNADSANAWKVRSDAFEKANLDWVLHGKNQDARISELAGRVNDLNAANATFVKANAALKNQVIFSSLMMIAALLPQILKWFAWFFLKPSFFCL